MILPYYKYRSVKKKRISFLYQESRTWMFSRAKTIKKGENLIRLVPGFPVFREAVSAIDRPALCWLEGDFAFFSTV
jgi:hypothetical protein